MGKAGKELTRFLRREKDRAIGRKIDRRHFSFPSSPLAPVKVRREKPTGTNTVPTQRADLSRIVRAFVVPPDRATYRKEVPYQPEHKEPFKGWLEWAYGQGLKERIERERIERERINSLMRANVSVHVALCTMSEESLS